MQSQSRLDSSFLGHNGVLVITDHRPILIAVLAGALPIVAGCGLFVADADREVYRLIEQRQLAALGQATDVRLNNEAIDIGSASDPYVFVPHPVTTEVPAEFKTVPPAAEEPPVDDQADVSDEPSPAPAPAPVPDEDGSEQDRASESVPGEDPASEPDSPSEPLQDNGAELLDDDQADPALEPGSEEEAEQDELYFGEPLTLPDALAFTVRYSRTFQDEKEDLYLQALSLTLERHLWTPRFASNLRATYTEFPQDSDPDRAMQATADVAVTQRLPYGGQVVAQWIGTMVRDLENHVTNSESGTAILSANIPLLRGGGRVAYESRYQAERSLIYAVRSYERFRRRFLTRVAVEYFNLLSTKGSIRNSIANRQSTRDNWVRSQALAEAERIDRLQADRANDSFLTAQNSVAVDKENYETALDEFKILIGMPTTNAIDVVEEGLDLPEPSVKEELAIETATRLRLDLLTNRDRVDDVRRGVEIARNNLLPDLDLSGSVSYTSNPDRLSAFDFREDDETWNFGVDLEIPLDRKAERNSYRSSLIFLRRAERGYDEALDRVRLEVRRARRQIDRAKFSMEIQVQNIRSNELRREQAQIRFEKGEIDNQDIVDADDALLRTRNDYDRAISDFRRAILEFRLATGTLRVGEDGRWLD